MTRSDTASACDVPQTNSKRVPHDAIDFSIVSAGRGPRWRQNVVRQSLRDELQASMNAHKQFLSHRHVERRFSVSRSRLPSLRPALELELVPRIDREHLRRRLPERCDVLLRRALEYRERPVVDRDGELRLEPLLG